MSDLASLLWEMWYELRCISFYFTWLYILNTYTIIIHKKQKYMKRRSFKADFLREEVAKRSKSFEVENIKKEVQVAKKQKKHNRTHQLAREAFERQERFEQRIIEKIHTARRNERKTLHKLKRQPDVYAEAG